MVRRKDKRLMVQRAKVNKARQKREKTSSNMSILC